MNKRIYGVIGIKSIMSNWNADFTGRPKTISDDRTFGSDKALKYSMKKYWEDKGEKVLYMKSYQIKDKDKLQPKTLEARYTELFEPIEKNTPSKDILKNLFSAIDVMCFGATFTAEKNNISITGAIQVGQGFNHYDKSEVEIQDILSPFSTDDTKDASTLGKKIVSDEAHYFYPVVVNPKAYNNYQNIVDDFNGFSDEAYELFKEASLCGATLLATNSKIGCENEFTLLVECDEEVYLPNLASYIEFEKGENDIIRLKHNSLLQQQGINKVEIYYNPYSSKVEGFDSDKTTYMNIFTKEVI
jgi:CRISPR-associated protein Csh2